MKENFVAYVTKYALTQGILQVNAEWDERHPGMITFREVDSRYDQYAHGSDWHRSPGVAAAKAEAMRQRKIASLHKSIEKMMSLKVEVKKC